MENLKTAENDSSPLGVFIIGAYGAVSTSSILGALGLSRNLFPPTGMITGDPAYRPLNFIDFDRIVFGGWDIRQGGLVQTAELLSRRDEIISSQWLEELKPEVAKIEGDILPGCTLHSGEFATSLSENKGGQNNREAIESISVDLRNFRQKHSLSRVLVINLASTMATPPFLEKIETREELERAIDRGDPIPASALYAYGAIKEGAAFLNFTPSPGTEIPPLDEMACEKGLPHMGKDGKTGETLLKTVLAPMFAARQFKVLSWVGYNILGNMDGEALRTPESNSAKVKTKGSCLKSLLPQSPPFSKVGIDYVPSLGDWKTAWDFIHFEGFMNTKMTFQFTWQGSDSMLAAPLVLDMIRLMDFAWREGEGGKAKHLASFFKFPLGVESHNYFEQFALLKTYLEGHLAARKKEAVDSKRPQSRAEQ